MLKIKLRIFTGENMYIVGLDRANLSSELPAYKICIANTHGGIVKTFACASRDLLKQIINHPNLEQPAVWSDREFDMIINLTGRRIKILQDIFIEQNAIVRPKSEVTPIFAFNRASRCLRYMPRISEDDIFRYEKPEFKVYENEHTHKPDVWLSALCYNTLLVSKIKYNIPDNGRRKS